MAETNSENLQDTAEEAKPPRKRAKRASRNQPEPNPEHTADSQDQAADQSSTDRPSSDDDIIFEENGEPGSNANSGENRENSGGQGNRRNRGGRRNRRNSNQRRGGGGGGGGGQGSNQRGGGRGNQTRERRQQTRRANVSPSDVEIVGDYEGVLELHPKGYGFLRDSSRNYGAQESDPFVSSSVIEKYKLREGVKIKGEVGPGTRGQGPRLKSIDSVDGRSPEDFQNIKHFDELTPINPFEQIKLETGPTPITMRVVDLLTPIGKGQRALIVAPPRTGKTMLLQDIAEAVSINHPEVKLIVLLIDERPEEVTEMSRMVKGDVIASSMDRDVESHIRISQLIFERGKRLAEAGDDVFILLDSITRTARAFNKWVGNSGRTATGGLDIRALDIPKKLFGTARRFEEGGSLTVVGTALIDTGSRADESIFQEFKGTGNMELVLSRDLADRRIWPAIDIGLSGTRREEKILDPHVLEGTTLLRRSLVSMSSTEAMEQLVKILQKYPSNEEFLSKVRAIL